MEEPKITLFEACQYLERSKKSITRYIRRGQLNPEKITSKQGTLEYRFRIEDLEAFKLSRAEGTEETRQDTTEGTEETRHTNPNLSRNKDNLEQTEGTEGTGKTRHEGHDRQDNKEFLRETEGTRGTEETGQRGHEGQVIELLKETTGLLKDQLIKKDEQIKNLSGTIDQLIERDRETNILLKGLQDRVFLLEGGREEQTETTDPTEYTETKEEPAEEPKEDLKDLTKQGFLKGLFRKK
jgi:hypothetical protein